MAKITTANAVALIQETKVVDEKLVQLQQDAIAHYQRMTELAKQRAVMTHEESLRSIVLGVNLLRIQASLPYGQWGKWRAKHMPNLSVRWVDYLMSLALVFISKAKVSKPADLALPGEQAALLLDGPSSDLAVLVKKAQKFVGKKSISELLVDYGIKKAALGGKRTKGEDDEGDGDEKATPEQLAARAREDLAELVTTARQLLLTDNVCQHLSPAEVKSFDAYFKALSTEWRASLKKTLGDTENA